MTRHIEGFGGMALALVEAEVGMLEALHHGLVKVVEKIEATAVAEIGVYQDAAGPFPEWPLLADVTEDEKARMGYPADAPLLAAGDLRDSFGHEVEGLTGIVGSTDPVLIFHEMGTSRMPARPVLGPAAFRNKESIEKLLGAAALVGLIGGERIHSALGYDMETASQPSAP